MTKHFRPHASYSYPIFDQLPAGCFAHIVADDSCDAEFRVGEIVIVDPSQSAQEIDHHYLIEWGNGKRSVIELFQLGPIEKPCVGGARRRPFAVPIVPGTASEVPVPHRWFDGWYNPEYLGERLKGRIVGFLEPEFDEALLREVSDARRASVSSHKRLVDAIADPSTEWTPL